MKDKYIKRAHGYGGDKTRELIKDIILPEISNTYADKLDDSAVLPFNNNSMIFTADAFVITPPFFPGGDIGKLAVAGTVNDIIAQAGRPIYLSMTVILEEGLEIEDLRKIAKSAGREAKKAGVNIVCGDLKVVERGKGDGIYVSTSGVGEKIFTLDKSKIDENDVIIVTSTTGDHGAAVFQARNKLLQENSNIYSDCNSLVELIDLLNNFLDGIKFMRDPTRGGLAEVMLELASDLKREITIEETKIPVKDWVRSLTYITGLDYLYLACEGNMVIVADKKSAVNILKFLNKNNFKDASIIGKVGSKNESPATILNTSSGGRRHLTGADIAQIPRIC